MVNGPGIQWDKKKILLVVDMKYGRMKGDLFFTSVIERGAMAIKGGFASNTQKYTMRIIQPQRRRSREMPCKQGLERTCDKCPSNWVCATADRDPMPDKLPSAEKTDKGEI
jgi:hypothetical protein